MKLVNINEVEIGMVLGEDIYGSFDMLYASKGDIITAKLLEGLIKQDLDFIYIETSDEVEEPQIEDNTTELVLSLINEELKRYHLLNRNVYERIEFPVSNVVARLVFDDEAISLLKRMSEIDAYTFNHAIHVGLLSGLIGYWQKSNHQTIEKLFYTGLFHDVGKLSIDKNILLKPGPLTDEEFELIKTHTLKGVELTSTLKDVDEDILQAILQHHEKKNGLGYPEKASWKMVHPYAKIVGVADVYDALTSKKCYSDMISPIHACDILFSESLESIDEHASTTLIRNMQKMYIGLKVRLSNGQEGEIVFINKYDPNKPLVKSGTVFYDMTNKDAPTIVDVI